MKLWYPRKFVNDSAAILLLVVAVIAMCYFLTNRQGTILLLLIICAFEVVRFARTYGAVRQEAGFEAAFWIVLLSILVFLHHGGSLLGHPSFAIGTVLYRKGYLLQYGNRRLAFLLSVMIVAAVLPVTLGFVTDDGVVGVLGGVYVSLVGCLWMFHSKLGSWIFDSSEI
jgi:hypothetical protein